MLTPREAFKVGFLSRCVEEGLSPDEMRSAVKQAMDKMALLGLESLPSKAVDAAGTGLKWGIPALLAAPPILGGLTGYAAARLTDIDDRDVDEVKARELIGEYQRQSERLNREKKVREARAQRAKPPRIYLG